MGTLLDLIAEQESLPDIRALAFRSGVDYRLLLSFDRGEASLADQHVEALAKILGNGSYKVLQAEPKAQRLEAERTRKGLAPAGRTIILTTADELSIDDLISYVPPEIESGSHWIEMSGIERRGPRDGQVDIYVAGQLILTVLKATRIRVARKII